MNLKPTVKITFGHDEIMGYDTITVEPVWQGVDRPNTGGWIISDTPSNRKLANRLKAAIEAGVVCTEPEIETDVNGKTYVNHGHEVIGRTMNADLKRLGY